MAFCQYNAFAVNDAAALGLDNNLADPVFFGQSAVVGTLHHRQLKQAAHEDKDKESDGGEKDCQNNPVLNPVGPSEVHVPHVNPLHRAQFS